MLKEHYFPGPDELAAAAAYQFLHKIQGRPSGQPYGIALSGGRIAKPFYQSIVQHLRSAAAALDDVHFFWADERCVPPDHPESSFAIARDYLFGPLNIPSSSIHRILGEIEPEFAARQAEAELCRLMPLDDSGQPILDLIILGMGEDGHVASLFPQEPPEIRSSTLVYRPVTSPKPPPNRVTLGYPALAAARDIWVLASGAGKLDAYNALKRGVSSLPIVQALRPHPEAVLFQDFAPPE